MNIMILSMTNMDHITFCGTRDGLQDRLFLHDGSKLDMRLVGLMETMQGDGSTIARLL